MIQKKKHVQKEGFVVICHDIRSTHNVGSIFRTSDGAGVSKIYLCGITPAPPRPDINKVSLGAENFVAFEYKKNTARLVTNLAKRGYQIIALENNNPGAIEYTTFRPTFPVALVLGSEVGGISKQLISLSDIAVFIPMRGMKESLNVSVAFGIVAYHISKYL